MNINMPAAAKSVLDILHARGFEAYIVGGCVRDFVLGRIPDDWDMTTSATPAQVKSIFHRTVDTGIAHGTVTVLLGGHAFEITTYRTGENPSSATDAKPVTLEQDLLHRDFTINAMAYNEQSGLIDLYGGMEDLAQKRIRCTKNASARFREDPLRMLRAVRFSAQLGFSIDAETQSAVQTLAGSLSGVSMERICTELTKLICSPNPTFLEIAYTLGLTKYFFPEFDLMMETEQINPHHIYSVGVHTLETLRNVPADRILRFGALFHDISKPDVITMDEDGIHHFKGHDFAGAKKAVKVMKRLRMDNSTINSVRDLVKYHDWRFKPEPIEIRKAVSVIGVELFPYILQLQYADVLAQSDYHKEEKLQRITNSNEVFREILARGDCLSTKELAITGKDLKELGVTPGPQMGEMIRMALEYVLEHPEENTKGALRAYLGHLI